MFHLDFAGAGTLIGIIAVAAGLLYGLPMKRKIERLDRSIARLEAEARAEAERAATRL